MKTTILTLTLLALLVGGCGQGNTKKQAATANDTVYQDVNPDIYAQLIKAIEADDRNSFDDLIKQITDINSYIQAENEYFSYTLLGYACKYRRCDLAGKLIGLGADIETGGSDDYLVNDALSVAVASDDLCPVKLLLDSGANPNRMNSEEGLTVLSLSCRQNNYDISKLLVEKGAKVDGLGYTEGTDYVHYPLLYAVESNNIKLVQLLIDNNCKIDIRNRQDETPFTIAERNGNQQMSDLLLENLLLQRTMEMYGE